jgi:hypothetical protein
MYKVDAKLTRRALGALLAASPVLAQTGANPAQTDLLRTELEDQKASSAKLSAYEIPMATEPAFQFKA